MLSRQCWERGHQFVWQHTLLLQLINLLQNGDQPSQCFKTLGPMLRHPALIPCNFSPRRVSAVVQVTS